MEKEKGNPNPNEIIVAALNTEGIPVHRRRNIVTVLDGTSINLGSLNGLSET